jgi:hypothetical protein
VLPYASVYQTVNPRQDSGLPAQGRVADLKQAPIPDNQWMVGVSHWFEAGLSRIRRGIVEYAAVAYKRHSGPQYLPSPTMLLPRQCATYRRSRTREARSRPQSLAK